MPKFLDEYVPILKGALILRDPECKLGEEDYSNIMKHTELNQAMIDAWIERVRFNYPDYNDLRQYLLSTGKEPTRVLNAMSDFAFEYTPEQITKFKTELFYERLKILEEQVLNLTKENHALIVKMEKQKNELKSFDKFTVAKEILGQAETLYDKIEATAECSAKRARID